MTTERKSKGRPDKHNSERPKLKKEKLKDLVAKEKEVMGGAGTIKATEGTSCNPDCSL